MKTLLLLITACFVYTSSYADIITVSNDVDSPGQYTSLQAAINAASVGDTILVSGSPTNYGSVTINKRLTLFGSGYDPANTFAKVTYLTNVTLARFDAVQSASGTKISGFNLDRVYINNNDPDTMKDITIERCLVSIAIYFQSFNVSDYRNVTVQNCVFTSASTNISFGNYSGVLHFNHIFRNNIFNGVIVGDISSSVNYTNLSLVSFRNNILTGSGTGTILDEVKNAVFENNIFFRKDAGNNDSDGSSAHCNGCAFDNNITYQSAFDTIPYGNNVGSGNLIATDPMLVNYPITGAAFSFSHDYTLMGGSPALLAGTDGTDIGITGGAAPFVVAAPPRIPQMTSILIGPPSAVPLNGTLQIQFTARKQN
ncbi:MAG: hypothetical protein DRI69_02655 [Bacteroidetes bacterium]|nr:MAG: hypothetical protein DRI69_02655 [Bacteroidota bacterium]